MNKILNIIKYIFLIISLILTTIYLKEFHITSIYFLTYLVFILLFTYISIKDLLKKNKTSNRYNILCIIVLLLISFIFYRTLYDNSLIYNSSYYMDLIKQNVTNYNDIKDNLKYQVSCYLEQNTICFIILLLSLILYRKIDINKKENSKYSLISLICLILSVISIIPTISIPSNNNIYEIILYLLFTITLIIVEIISLIKNNHKKREWIIYISFIFNLFALIFILAAFKNL